MLKKNNNKTGVSLIFSPHFHLFGKVLGTRNAVNIQHVESLGNVDLLNFTLVKMKLISSSFIITLFHLASF